MVKMTNRKVSKQNWRTPLSFLLAVQERFGGISWDLAASLGEGVVPDERCFSPELDSLAQDWKDPRLGKVAWLNPPFADIDPWVKLASECRDLPRWTLVLVPASIGTRWYEKHVLGKAMVFGVGRMKFIGSEQQYPKDLMLIAYGYGVSGHGFFDWKKVAKQAAKLAVELSGGTVDPEVAGKELVKTINYVATALGKFAADAVELLRNMNLKLAPGEGVEDAFIRRSLETGNPGLLVGSLIVHLLRREGFEGDHLTRLGRRAIARMTPLVKEHTDVHELLHLTKGHVAEVVHNHANQFGAQRIR
jgi:phage N-6-adenine-methyltransferase